MELNDVLTALEYRGSPNFLQGQSLEADRDFGHIFRKAKIECGLQGVYVLNGSSFEKSRGTVPVVYVCKAATEAEARQIHQQVWNQNVVPFLLVVSPKWVRLYPGFRYQRDPQGSLEQEILPVLEDFSRIAVTLKAIQASSVDTGNVWAELGRDVTPEKRVDWQLLENLRDLDAWLQQDGVQDPRLSHAMIGKFVYLRYLRQRDILSDKRLAEEWRIDPADAFGPNAKLSSFLDLVHHVDTWLNGSVFPLSASKIREFGAERLRKVASVFHGEQVASGQLPLFDVYDFSFIPIETLSVIYEQFLHATSHPSGRSEGEARGAYYTPVPLVNFMLDQLDSRKPLQLGMRVLDPSCGSGAFLVQCYRKLVERRRIELRRKLRPAELGALLTNHIFGVDIDEDACQIAELSLALTLLDYIDPPDLTETPWKLPALRDRNIFQGSAFDDDSHWYNEARRKRYHWIVGNPPWKDINPADLDTSDKTSWEWMKSHAETCPVGGNQLAEAFVWRSAELLHEQGAAALLLPAMTLFKYESVPFRRSFLGRYRLWFVANFANLADVLFAGRATLPAAALFFSNDDVHMAGRGTRTVEVYSPLLANQPATQSGKGRRRQEVWNIIVNSSDLREIEYSEVADGKSLPWKLAMWGSSIDRKILRTVEKRFRSIEDLENAGAVFISQGMELRKNGTKGTERHDELAGKVTIDVDPLKNRRYLFRFPAEAKVRVQSDSVSVRKGRFSLPHSVCVAPHVLVGASRNFAVFSDEFVIVPARQIGIASPNSGHSLLKALALYLNSDFVRYHQFLATTQAGIQKSINTLKALRALPVPFDPDSELGQWTQLYAAIEKACGDRDSFNETELVAALNELVFDSLKLSRRGRAAVHDLVHVRFGLTRGKVGKEAVAKPSADEQASYARMLRDELDSFVGESSPTRHKVDVLSGDDSGVVSIDLIADKTSQLPVKVLESSQAGAIQLAQARSTLLEHRAQWLYFNRNLRIYDGSRTYILKPLQRLHWTQTQAIDDAREIIADALHTDVPSTAGASH